MKTSNQNPLEVQDTAEATQQQMMTFPVKLCNPIDLVEREISVLGKRQFCETESELFQKTQLQILYDDCEMEVCHELEKELKHQKVDIQQENLQDKIDDIQDEGNIIENQGEFVDHHQPQVETRSRKREHLAAEQKEKIIELLHEANVEHQNITDHDADASEDLIIQQLKDQIIEYNHFLPIVEVNHQINQHDRPRNNRILGHLQKDKAHITQEYANFLMYELKCGESEECFVCRKPFNRPESSLKRHFEKHHFPKLKKIMGMKECEKFLHQKISWRQLAYCSLIPTYVQQKMIYNSLQQSEELIESLRSKIFDNIPDGKNVDVQIEFRKHNKFYVPKWHSSGEYIIIDARTLITKFNFSKQDESKSLTFRFNTRFTEARVLDQSDYPGFLKLRTNCKTGHTLSYHKRIFPAFKQTIECISCSRNVSKPEGFKTCEVCKHYFCLKCAKQIHKAEMEEIYKEQQLKEEVEKQREEKQKDKKWQNNLPVYAQDSFKWENAEMSSVSHEHAASEMMDEVNEANDVQVISNKDPDYIAFGFDKEESDSEVAGADKNLEENMVESPQVLLHQQILSMISRTAIDEDITSEEPDRLDEEAGAEASNGRQDKDVPEVQKQQSAFLSNQEQVQAQFIRLGLQNIDHERKLAILQKLIDEIQNSQI